MSNRSSSKLCREADRVALDSSIPDDDPRVHKAFKHAQACPRCKTNDQFAKQLAKMAADQFWKEVAEHGLGDNKFPSRPTRIRRILAPVKKRNP